MLTPDPKHDLQTFQDYGDTDSLRAYIQATGRDLTRYEAALQALAAVLEPLAHGEYPRYQELNQQQLRAQEIEVLDIVTWMAGSAKADMQASAAQLRSLLERTV
jgi:hypothetical protein